MKEEEPNPTATYCVCLHPLELLARLVCDRSVPLVWLHQSVPEFRLRFGQFYDF